MLNNHRIPRLRIGSVSYLNARPLIHGLEEGERLELMLDVPSRLLDGLRQGRFDVALLPVIDYQRMEGLRLIPAGGIGCDGPTLTVRIFSRVPIEGIESLACDTDSHTSVALARIILAEKYGIRPEFIDLNKSEGEKNHAQLLIGDKVVCEEPQGYPHQLDLGYAWKEMTGLPFVFAAWMARGGVELDDLPERLERSKWAGLAHLDEIIAKHAVPRGWPAGLALEYLARFLKFDIGPPQLEAMRYFYQLLAKHGIISDPPRAMEMVGRISSPT